MDSYIVYQRGWPQLAWIAILVFQNHVQHENIAAGSALPANRQVVLWTKQIKFCSAHESKFSISPFHKTPCGLRSYILYLKISTEICIDLR